jgi:hypothetical protein
LKEFPVNYPGIIRGVRKNSSSWEDVLTLLRLKRLPISGRLPIIGV